MRRRIACPGDFPFHGAFSTARQVGIAQHGDVVGLMPVYISSLQQVGNLTFGVLSLILGAGELGWEQFAILPRIR